MDDRPYFSDLHGAWFFYDETGDSMGPYSSHKEAMKAYNNYCYYLNHGPKVWWYILHYLTGTAYVPF